MNINDFAYIVETKKSFDEAVVSVISQFFPEIDRNEAEQAERDVIKMINNAM